MLVVIITTLLMLSRDALAAPQTISFSARLRNASGGVVPDGRYNVSFRLYNLQAGGGSIWSETYYDENGPTTGEDYRVKVVNGYLNVKLGARSAFNGAVNWSDDLWLTMNIGGTNQVANVNDIAWDGEMSPRIQLGAVPYAMSAGSLDGRTADDFIEKTSDLQSGSINLAGAIQSESALLAPAVDTATAGQLTIGGTNATSIELAQDVTVASGKSLTLAGGSTATRPTSPTEGMLYYDTTTKQLLVYANGKWKSDSKVPTQIVAASTSSQALKDSADFVADGDNTLGVGVIDGDQVQINAAIAALPVSGGTVYLSEGTYFLDSSIVIPSNITLSGAGAASVVTVGNGFDASIPLVVNSNPTSGNSNITIHDLTFHGNRDNLISSNEITAVSLTNVGSGSGATASTGAIVRNNTFTHLRGDAVVALNSHNSHMHHNAFINSASRGVNLDTSANNRVTDNSFNGVTMAIRMAAATHSFISNNSIDGSSDTNGAIEMQTASSFNTIIGNSLKNNTSHSLRLATSSSNLISNNLFMDNGGTGANHTIWIVGNSDDNTISRNTFRDTVGTGHAISIDSTSANRTYLDGNSLSGVGASTINDIATDTIYGGQQDSSGNFVIKPSGTTALSGNVNVSGTLSAQLIQGGTIDTAASSGTLNVGTTLAGTVNVGNSGSTTNISGNVSLQGNGQTLLTASAASNQITLGAVDANATLLVLDTKNTAGDPAGTNGAMYYNSNAGKFRCYENGTWKDCVTPLPVSKVASSDTSNSTITPVDVNGLSFPLAANTKYYYKFVIIHEATLDTTGIGFGITGPSSLTTSNWCVNTTATLASSAPGHWGSYCGVGDADATTSGIENQGTNFTSTMEGYIETGANSGDLKLRMKSEAAQETIVKTGSFGLVQIVQ